MTLSGRNGLFKAEIVLAVLSALTVIAASLVVLPAYASLSPELTRHSEGVFHAFVSRFQHVNLYAVHASIAGSALYALLVLILIYHSFETTQSPEILFVAFFAGSFAFEALRLILPLKEFYEIPSLYLLMASRMLLFSRYFGIFSLFTASVYAAGLEVRKQRNVILVITVATLIIALGVPIDTQTWDSTLNMINGYVSLFRLIETGVALITVISFLIAAYSRGSKEYAFIGAGAFLAFLGRNLLLNADTWVGPVPGILLLSAGIWFICTQLHKIYLWL
ncbi:MAG: hypothetical protein LBS37_05725 [Treponema sp.]|jgi:hypothetical protein|nr:hypothetical protein [Treponema sp.]